MDSMNRPRFINNAFFRGSTRDVDLPAHQTVFETVTNLPAATPIKLGSEVIPHNPTKWKPFNVLGEGGMGMASLWRYNDPGSEHHNLFVVLKTGINENAERNMMREGDIMEKLRVYSKDEHHVKMIYRDVNLRKLYLEFCVGGDLHEELARRFDSKTKMEEEKVWRLFLCLCKGLVAMHEYHPNKTIIHNDIKGMNVFIQKDPTIHTCVNSYPLFKIADFGLAYDVLKEGHPNGAGSVNHARRMGARGTPYYYAPEQHAWELQMSQSRETDAEWVELYGGLTPKLDVFAIGEIIWMFMMLSAKAPTAEYEPDHPAGYGIYMHTGCRFTDFSEGPSYGEGIHSSGYSADLNHLVAWTLRAYQDQRCSSSELLRHLEDGVAMYNNQAVMEDQRRGQEVSDATPLIPGLPEPEDENNHAWLRRNHYGKRLENLLAEQGRTEKYYDDLLKKLSAEGQILEERRLLEAFYINEGGKPDYMEYARRVGCDKWSRDEWDPVLGIVKSADLFFVVIYQMAYEAQPDEMQRALNAYIRRTPGQVNYTVHTRMTLIRLQRRYEMTSESRRQLFKRFEERHRNNPNFMEGASVLEKLRVQRAYEDGLPVPSPVQPEPLSSEDRSQIQAAFVRRIKRENREDYFSNIFKQEGRFDVEIQDFAVHTELRHLSLATWRTRLAQEEIARLRGEGGPAS